MMYGLLKRSYNTSNNRRYVLSYKDANILTDQMKCAAAQTTPHTGRLFRELQRPMTMSYGALFDFRWRSGSLFRRSCRLMLFRRVD